jgi:hypothetical protein
MIPDLQVFLLQQLVDKGFGIATTVIGSVLAAIALRHLRKAKLAQDDAAAKVEQIVASHLDAASLQGWARTVDHRLEEHDRLLAAAPPPTPERPARAQTRRSTMPRTQFGDTIPQVLDPVVRVLRTVIQVLIAFVSLAPILPLIVSAIGAPAGSQYGVTLTAAAVWVAGVAAAISRIMAIPAVNALLGRIGLAGHSGVYTGDGDTQTRFVPTVGAQGTVDSLH